jgi:uncharacterized protein (DUF305 family)
LVSRTQGLGVICIVAAAAVSVMACGSAAPPAHVPLVQPGAPGQSSQVVDPHSGALAPPRPSAADIAFMQGMIHHHAQALDMTELLKTRTSSDAMRKLALRIEVSQSDEIKMMQQWLTAHGQEAPSQHAHHMAGSPMMPGMLTPDEMDRLAAAKGTEFDRLFLEGMIKHHAGALTMVKELFATPGAAQDSDIFAFASDVDADQRMEINRMSAMLEEIRK